MSENKGKKVTKKLSIKEKLKGEGNVDIDTSKEELNAMGKENVEFLEKYALDWKALNWIRLTYGMMSKGGGQLTEKFLLTLNKAKIVCNSKDSTANKNAYTMWIGPKQIRFPYGTEVWLPDEALLIIASQECAVDNSDYHEDRENNVTGTGKLTSTLGMMKLYDVNVLATMEELKK